jgi:exoribonuclease-2
MKEGPAGSMLVRADELPLVFPVLGAQSLPRGAQVRVKLGEIDEITLDVTGTVLERLDDEQANQAETESPEDEEEAVAGPIAIAVDMGDGEDAATTKTD